MRQNVRDANLGEMLIGGGAIKVSKSKGWEFDVFDFACDYMYIAELENSETDYLYKIQADYIRVERKKQLKSQFVYMPFIGAGWNPRSRYSAARVGRC